MCTETREFKGYILEALAEGYNLTPAQADHMMEQVDFDHFFNDMPEAALNYTPEFWAERIYQGKPKEYEHAY